MASNGKGKRERQRRTLDAKTRQRILTAGRKRNRGTTKEVADQLRTDVAIVRRVWQAAGILDVPVTTKRRAEKLVETWLKRGRES